MGEESITQKSQPPISPEGGFKERNMFEINKNKTIN